MIPDLKKASVKNKVEAVLFSTGDKMSVDEICRLCRSKNEEVIAALHELKKEYEEKQSSLMLVEDGNLWKFTVRDHFMPIIRRIVTETELPRSVLETLAVIAFSYPILQSDLIKTRSNKGYEHLTQLEAAGYITRQRHGRTNLIKLTEKFFKYFDLSEEQLKDKFRDFESIAKAIDEKEKEADKAKEDQKAKAQEIKNQDEKIKKEIESLDAAGEDYNIPLKTYEAAMPAPAETPVKAEQEEESKKVGGLDVVELNEDTDIPKPEDRDIQEAAERKTRKEEEQPAKINDGVKLDPGMEERVDKRVEEIVGGDKTEKRE